MKGSYTTVIILSAVGLIALLFGKKMAAFIQGLFTKTVTNTVMETNNVKLEVVEFGTANAFNKKYGMKEKDVLTVRAKNPALFWFGDDWQGLDKEKTKDKSICYFKDKASGIRAQIKTLLNYQRRHLRMTLTAIINSWAPAGVHGNQPDKYIEYMVKHLGIGANTPMNFDSNPETLAKVAFVIHTMEAGFAWIDYSEFLTSAKANALAI